MFDNRANSNIISILINRLIGKSTTLVSVFAAGSLLFLYSEYRKPHSFVRTQTDRLYTFGKKVVKSKITEGTQNAKNCIREADKNTHPRDVVECIVVER